MTTFTPSFTLLADYLEQNNYTVSGLDPAGLSTHFVSIQSNTSGARLVMNAKHPTYPFPTASGRRIYLDKELAYAYVKSLGFSTPGGITVTSCTDERLGDFLQEQRRVIVKPQNGHGSQGLTLDVTTLQALEGAITTALAYSDAALVQKQFIGEEVRFTVVDGSVKSALLREKPHVIGDGRSTVAQLIEAENEARQALPNTAVPYPMLDEKLVAADVLASRRVPADGERVELGLGTMIRTGASMYEVLDSIDASYRSIVETIARSFGPGFLAIDMMIADIHQPAQQNTYIFLEINSDPALVLYYSCRDGRHPDIVRHYLGPKLIQAIEGVSA